MRRLGAWDDDAVRGVERCRMASLAGLESPGPSAPYAEQDRANQAQPALPCPAASACLACLAWQMDKAGPGWVGSPSPRPFFS